MWIDLRKRRGPSRIELCISDCVLLGWVLMIIGILYSRMITRKGQGHEHHIRLIVSLCVASCEQKQNPVRQMKIVTYMTSYQFPSLYCMCWSVKLLLNNPRTIVPVSFYWQSWWIDPWSLRRSSTQQVYWIFLDVGHILCSYPLSFPVTYNRLPHFTQNHFGASAFPIILPPASIDTWSFCIINLPLMFPY